MAAAIFISEIVHEKFKLNWYIAEIDGRRPPRLATYHPIEIRKRDLTNIHHWLIVTIFALFNGVLMWVYRKRGKELADGE